MLRAAFALLAIPRRGGAACAHIGETRICQQRDCNNSVEARDLPDGHEFVTRHCSCRIRPSRALTRYSAVVRAPRSGARRAAARRLFFGATRAPVFPGRWTLIAENFLRFCDCLHARYRQHARYREHARRDWSGKNTLSSLCRVMDVRLDEKLRMGFVLRINSSTLQLMLCLTDVK